MSELRAHTFAPELHSSTLPRLKGRVFNTYPFGCWWRFRLTYDNGKYSYLSPNQWQEGEQFDVEYDVTFPTWLNINSCTLQVRNYFTAVDGDTIDFWPLIPSAPTEAPPFLITSFIVWPTPWNIRVVVETTTPCKLTLFYSTAEPTWQIKWEYKRGAPVRELPYWHFWYWAIQQESTERDDLEHIFIVPALQPRPTIWVCFTGTVYDLQSPSISPFFEINV